MSAERAPRPGSSRVVALSLDEGSIVRWGPEVEHERHVAVFDLLEQNSFELVAGFAGPYRVVLSLRDSNLVFDVQDEAGEQRMEIVLSIRPMRRVVKDYFLICDGYYKAIKGAAPSRIEAIDMARRGLHDEGADALREALAEKIFVDPHTARRLFTLICVLHIRG